MRAGVVLIFLAPAIAGCVGQSDTVLPARLDAAVPHCVGDCARIVDGSPARAWEAFLAVDPKDPNHVVIAHTEFIGGGVTFTRARVSVSEDGGTTWDTRAVPGGPEAGPTHPLGRYSRTGGDPVVVFLPDGTLVTTGLAGNIVSVPGVPVQVWPGTAIYTSRSTDGGRTWGGVRILDPGEGIMALDTRIGDGTGAMWKFNYKPWLTVDLDGTLLLVWSQYTQMHPDNGFSQEWDGRIVFSSSQDGGLTWSPARIVDDAGYPTGASPVIGRDGAWRVAYLDHATDEMRFAESRDDGQTWDARTLGATSRFPVMRAQTLASDVERLLLVYTTGGEGYQGELQTELTWSDDGGATWASALVIDTPQGEGYPMPDVAGAPGDAGWVTFFDIEGTGPGQRSRYLAVKVVDGVVGAPLVLDELDAGPNRLGQYMGLGVTADGDALAAWVTYEGGEYDLVWARITGGDEPVAQPIAQPPIPRGLDEPVPYEFTGHVNVAYYCFDPNPTSEQAVRDQASQEFEFKVPPNTRFVNGTLDWETTGPTAETSDLDLVLFDSEGDRLDAGTNDVPEMFHFELHEGDQGTWTAVVLNCENPPTDFTLSLWLS